MSFRGWHAFHFRIANVFMWVVSGIHCPNLTIRSTLYLGTSSWVTMPEDIELVYTWDDIRAEIFHRCETGLRWYLHYCPIIDFWGRCVTSGPYCGTWSGCFAKGRDCSVLVLPSRQLWQYFCASHTGHFAEGVGVMVHKSECTCLRSECDQIAAVLHSGLECSIRKSFTVQRSQENIYSISTYVKLREKNE